MTLSHPACSRPHLEIDVDDRELLWRLIRESGSRAMPDQMDAFVADVNGALARYQRHEEEDHQRKSAREDLRELFMACADRRNTAKIRRKFPRLPILARDELLRRTKMRYPGLSGGVKITWEGLYVWTQTCPDEELIAKLPGVIAAGLAVSLGQLRENGNTSALHLEPMIMGEFLRLKPVGEAAITRKSIHKSGSIHKGGHPADAAVDALVTDLALPWLEATGAPPRSSRSTTTPFGRLAHLVLGKAGVASPENALRRFWASVKYHKARPSPIPVD